MTTLVLGASGATGKQCVNQLLERKQHTRIIVRSKNSIPENWKKQELLTIVQASLLDLSDDEIKHYVKDCNAVISCLGHNITWKGIYGQPRKLVTDVVRRVTDAIISNKPEKPVKYVLMNTTGNRNRDLDEKVSIGEKLTIGLIRLLLPPQVDNEEAAEYLRTKIGQSNQYVEWTAVRPDGLTNDDEVTVYDVHPSPIRSAIFNAGKTSRINVGHFMAELITNSLLWNKWKGKMPVIYNRE